VAFMINVAGWSSLGLLSRRGAAILTVSLAATMGFWGGIDKAIAASAGCVEWGNHVIGISNGENGNEGIVGSFQINDVIQIIFSPASGFTPGVVFAGSGIYDVTRTIFYPEDPLTGIASVTLTSGNANDVFQAFFNTPEDGGGTMTLACQSAVATLTLTSTPSSILQIGQPYSQTNVANGGTTPYTYSLAAGTLPAGTTFNTSNGTVSGRPTTAGAFSYSIEVTDSTIPTAQTVTNNLSGTIGVATATIALTSSLNPSSYTQPVTFTATVTGNSPTGTVNFFDGTTQIGSSNVSGGTASFTTVSLAVGSHSITAKYSGDANNHASTSATLVQTVNIAADSIKLRELQVSVTPMIANVWAQSITRAIDSAIGIGFSDDTTLTLNGSGFTYYFDADPNGQYSASDRDNLNRFLASPSGNGDDKQTYNAAALDYAGPAKAPPQSPGPPRDWLAWIDVRHSGLDNSTVSTDLKGDQLDAIAGLTHRLTSNFLVGVLGGYEHFDYSSQALTGTLRGGGWTAGTYLGWQFAPHLRFEAGTAWSDIFANDVAGAAAGNFSGSRWLATSGVTGTYEWQAFVVEPSARIYALWEQESAYTDSLGTVQAGRDFDTGRASGGLKVSYPRAWTSTVNLAPYAGLYGDYYFSMDSAAATGLTTVPLLEGWSARAIVGIAARFSGGVQLSAGSEYGGIGSATHIWTWTMRGSVPF
jgi:hypothetical protein